MPVDLCVLLWALPGAEQLLVDYEDAVLALLTEHDGQLVQRVRRSEPGDGPDEVQLIRFGSETAYAGFMADPERLALAPQRELAVARTEVFPVAVLEPAGAPLPRLVGSGVTLRPGTEADLPALLAALLDPSVALWWGEPEAPDGILAKLRGESYAVELVIEVDGEVAGGIEFLEEDEPDYRHASIDIFLAERFQGRGVGAEAVGLLTTWLVQDRGHHRLTIDPAATNAAAIACYAKVGFKRVGLMRGYERGRDGSYHDGLLMDLVADELAPEGQWTRLH
jgi:aminoglycoside 6'-N-acetyltransferase